MINTVVDGLYVIISGDITTTWDISNVHEYQGNLYFDVVGITLDTKENTVFFWITNKKKFDDF